MAEKSINAYDDQNFEVEKILARRKRERKVEYLIKWKGFSSEENSWEPEENMNECQELVRQFQKREKEMNRMKRGRANGFYTEEESPSKSSDSTSKGAEEYQILHRVHPPPSSENSAEMSRHKESKFIHREEKEAHQNKEKNEVVLKRKTTHLRVLAVVVLFCLIIFALVAPVGSSIDV
ncbi:chromobox protein homolog 5-like isoform X2 [Xenia sp. Carnegie-2017]|uniref:chromobox protein homolog 5-like isoform X2 n=1 Tax=Xenia sp. Carnegie-2017 TaxID=2897299 RepID=UPI001F03FF45|nr:chromobox protein homolog 5-like isoform X2 [Xenia sp. Carnegie-2017]